LTVLPVPQEGIITGPQARAIIACTREIDTRANNNGGLFNQLALDMLRLRAADGSLVGDQVQSVPAQLQQTIKEVTSLHPVPPLSALDKRAAARTLLAACRAGESADEARAELSLGAVLEADLMHHLPHLWDIRVAGSILQTVRVVPGTAVAPTMP
jgi:hypothetical protein